MSPEANYHEGLVKHGNKAVYKYKGYYKYSSQCYYIHSPDHSATYIYKHYTIHENTIYKLRKYNKTPIKAG